MASAAEANTGVDLTALLRLIIGLVIVVGAIVALAWFLRRLGGVGHNAHGQLRVLAGIAVGQRERVVLIQVGQQQLLLGVAPGRVQTLHVLEQPVAGLTGTEGGRSATAPFADRLRRAMQQQGGKRE